MADVDVITALDSGSVARDVPTLGLRTSTKETNPDAASATVNALLRGILQILIDGTVSQVAHDAAAATIDPVLVGGYASTATPTAVSADIDAVRQWLTRFGAAAVTPVPHTAGGLTIHRSIDLDEGALEVVKASAGQVYSMWVANTSSGTRFIKFYDATSGTVGTGTPVLTIPIPGNSSDDVAGIFNAGGLGIAFATGICVGASTGVADADTGAPGANDVIVNIFFK